MPLITEQSLRAIPGILSGSLSSLSSVVTSLAALQSTNPGLFVNFSSQIDSLMRGFDTSSNIINAVGGLADSARQLATTDISPSNILQFASTASNVERLLGEIVGGYDSRFASVNSYRPSVQQASQNANQSEALMYFPDDLGKYWFAMAFVPFQYNFREGGQGQVVTGPVENSIMFPVPSSLTDQLFVSYEEFSPVPEALQGFITAIEGALPEGLRGTVDKLKGLATTGAKIGSLYGGVAINPATTLLLQGPKLKEHSFSWRFSPDSVEGSRKLNNIINTIKRNMSPSFGSAFGSTIFGSVIGTTLRYPMMVKCAFYNMDKLYQFKPAMITSFSVNYAPTNTPAFFNSEYPAEIEMKISIKEVEAWLANDYGYGLSQFGLQGPGSNRF